MYSHVVEARVEEVTRLLTEEFGGRVSTETVRRCVAAACEHFADARIDAYLSLFVAREARRALRTGETPPGGSALPHEL